jgi:hypothetical protein
LNVIWARLHETAGKIKVEIIMENGMQDGDAK